MKIKLSVKPKIFTKDIKIGQVFRVIENDRICMLVDYKENKYMLEVHPEIGILHTLTSSPIELLDSELTVY